MKGYKNDLEGQAAMLVLPVIVSLLNTLIPFFFSWLGHLEKFQTPGQYIYVTIIRYFYCCHLLVLLALSCLILFDPKLCLGGVGRIGSCGGEFIFSKGFCKLLSL